MKKTALFLSALAVTAATLAPIAANAAEPAASAIATETPVHGNSTAWD